MQHDWFMYHLRSTYKNRLDFPFKNKAQIARESINNPESFRGP